MNLSPAISDAMSILFHEWFPRPPQSSLLYRLPARTFLSTAELWSKKLEVDAGVTDNVQVLGALIARFNLTGFGCPIIQNSYIMSTVPMMDCAYPRTLTDMHGQDTCKWCHHTRLMGTCLSTNGIYLHIHQWDVFPHGYHILPIDIISHR